MKAPVRWPAPGGLGKVLLRLQRRLLYAVTVCCWPSTLLLHIPLVNGTPMYGMPHRHAALTCPCAPYPPLHTASHVEDRSSWGQGVPRQLQQRWAVQP